VLFATHYLHEADDAADRVVVIAAGRKVADGPPAAIKATFGDRQVRFTLAGGSPARLGSGLVTLLAYRRRTTGPAS
jgi:ABC-2 type transport system ATP-binding protein